MCKGNILFLLYFIYFFFQEFECVTVLSEYVLQDGNLGNCDENIANKPSVLIRSHVGAGLFGGLNSYKANEDCSVTFETETDHKILVQFPFFELQPPDNTDCTDKIVITEKGTGSTDVTEICTKQGQNKNKFVLGYFMWRTMTGQHEKIEYHMQVPEFTSATEKIEIKFVSDSSVEKKGFVAVVTSFHEETCSGSEFKCDTTRCISADLKCDGHDHCIDKTDESNEMAGCSVFDEAVSKVTSLGQYGILAIAVVVGGVLLTIFITVLLWKYMKKDGKCCECSDADDDNDIESNSGPRLVSRQVATKHKKGAADKTSSHKFVKDDHKVTKKIKVKGKHDPDIEW